MATSSNPLDLSDALAKSHFYTGLALAVSSSVFIGSSFIVKKKGLLRINKQGQTRAGAGGYGYLKEWVWWTGLILMAVGEAANFAAYAFAPASLVTPLGALSVLVSALLSSKFLNERLNLVGKVGCLLCILGSTVIVLHSPKEGNVESMEQLGAMITEPCERPRSLACSLPLQFGYAFRVTCNLLQLQLLLKVICRQIPKFMMLNSKSNALHIIHCIGHHACNMPLHPALTICLHLISKSIKSLFLQALDVFNTSVVTPIYYVFFTTFVLIASAILFKEWGNMTAEDLIGMLTGFLTVVCAIFLLNAFKDWDVSLSSLQGLLQSTRDQRDDLTAALLEERPAPTVLGVPLQHQAEGYQRINSKDEPL
ncbi:conserved hypothetical protein, partial [Ixodes scapularis]